MPTCRFRGRRTARGLCALTRWSRATQAVAASRTPGTSPAWVGCRKGEPFQVLRAEARLPAGFLVEGRMKCGRCVADGDLAVVLDRVKAFARAQPPVPVVP